MARLMQYHKWLVNSTIRTKNDVILLIWHPYPHCGAVTSQSYMKPCTTGAECRWDGCSSVCMGQQYEQSLNGGLAPQLLRLFFFLSDTHTQPTRNVSNHFLLVTSQTAVFPERTWEPGLCKLNLWSQLHFQFWFQLTVIRMWLCCCERSLLHVAQQLLSLWAVLMYTSIIFPATGS